MDGGIDYLDGTVGGAAAMTSWLTGLDQPSLARLLANRPDALLAPQPSSLAELGERLGAAESVAAALRGLPLPCLQLVEAALALGGTPVVSELTAFLAVEAGASTAPTAHDERVTQWLQVLSEHGIAWLDGELVNAPPRRWQ